jgi:spore coat polysaccharide biosynthesis protein SpsF
MERVVERTRLAKSIHEVVVATSVNKGDDIIAELCGRKGIECYRGSEDDVLGRVYEAAKKYKADIVISTGADNPFHDAEITDMLVHVVKYAGYSYAANDMTLTFPDGIDSHVMRFDALKASALEAKHPQERLDTPRFIWNNAERFPIYNIEALKGSYYNRPEIRLSIDYKEDMELARLIYKELYPRNNKFSSYELIKFLTEEHPEWLEINKNCEQQSAAYVKAE